MRTITGWIIDVLTKSTSPWHKRNRRGVWQDFLCRRNSMANYCTGVA